MDELIKTIPNAWNLKVGDIEPILGLKICEIIFKQYDFIVYLDDKDEMNWVTYEGYEQSKYPDDFGHVTQKIEYLSYISSNLFKSRDKLNFNRMLGEAITRLLDDGNTKYATQMLDNIENVIIEKAKLRHRIIYVVSSIITTIILGLIIFVMHIECIWFCFPIEPHIHTIISASLFGGIGAFLFAFFRYQSYNPHPSSNNYVNIIDGALRNFYGIIGGLLVALGIKAEVIFGFINIESNDSKYLLYFLCMIAGASEVFIPYLISRVENGK